MSKPEKLDFLFLYEHKVRELENLCLLKYELDRRGYRTKILYINDAQNELSPKPLYDTKVLCLMACYGNKTLRWHAKEYIRFERVIDLQWENIVYPKDEEREGAYKNYTGIGKDVVHVSWGRMNERRLLNAAHISRDNVKLIGHVGMDFLRKPLSAYYKSREELFKKYDLPVDNRTILFASTYYSDTLSQEYIDDMCQRFGEDWTVYYKFMCDSQKIVLDWFDKACEKDENLTIIYRAHPGHPSLMAEDVAKKHKNFRIIAENSVKQWILACDKVYTGNGSVIVEAFFADKDCQLIFPLPVTPGYELKLIENSKVIDNYDRLQKSLYSDEEEFPVPVENIEEIYITDKSTPSYIRFCDMAEEVLSDDRYKLTRRQLRDYKEYPLSIRVLKALCRIDGLYSIYLKMLDNDKINWKFIVNQRKLRQIPFDKQAKDTHELASEEEIQSIIARIKTAIETK